MNLKGYKHRFPEKTKRYFAVLLTLIGYLFFPPILVINLLKKKKIEQGKIKKILIVRNDGIGDFIISLPALHLLRETFQKAQITILIPNWQKELALASNLFNEIIVFNGNSSNYFSSSLNLKNLFFEMLSWVPTLRQKKFDFAIDIRGDFRNRVVIFLSAVPYRVSFDIGGLEYLLTHQTHYRKNVHEVEHFFDLIAQITNNKSSMRNFTFSIPFQDREIARIFLESNGVNPMHEPLVVVHPVARWPAKEWPKAKYAKLCDMLIDRCKAKVIIIGSPEDADSIKEILSLIKEKPISSTGMLSLLQVAALMEKADLFIGNDAAPMHIAAAIGTPVVALFGPTDPEIYGPYGDGYVVRADTPCLCNSKQVCAKPENFCMDKITVDHVFYLAKRYIEQKKA